MKKGLRDNLGSLVFTEADKRTRTVDLLITNFLTGVSGNLAESHNVVFMRVVGFHHFVWHR